MVILGLLIRVHFNFIFILGLAIVFGHNLLDISESATGFKAGFLWDLMHHGFFVFYPLTQNHALVLLYPFVPWTGLMMLGYCTGILYSQKFSVEQRRKNLNSIGIGLILLFAVVRFINIYGNPEAWSTQKNGLFTMLSFIDVHKYPPSLLYMCITIGTALLLLPFLERSQNRFTNTMRIYGRVAFFYYVVHIYLIHLVSAICYIAKGHSLQEATNINGGLPFYFLASKDGYSLPVVYLIWICVVIALYPICKWYDNYKTNHREKWWLSYL